jgi:hypothetical protein
MSKKQTHYEETRFGFEYGALSIERMWSHDGHVCIRIVERKSKKSKYVDIQASPTGRKIHVRRGTEADG